MKATLRILSITEPSAENEDDDGPAVPAVDRTDVAQLRNGAPAPSSVASRARGTAELGAEPEPVADPAATRNSRPAREGRSSLAATLTSGLGTLLGRARGAASERGGHEDDGDDEGEEDDDEYSGDDTSAGGAPATPRDAAANGTGNGVENVDGFMIEQCGGEEVFGVPVTGLTSCNACAEPPRRADSVTQTTAGSSGLHRYPSRSPSKSHLLLHATSGGGVLQCYDVDQRRAVAEFVGPKPLGTRFVLRAAFGGPHDGFVACGSDDACVHLWRRSHAGLPVASLRGHAGTVNMVAWRPPREPTQPPLLASVSDDHTVILWSSCEAE